MSIVYYIDIGFALTAALINSAFILLVLTRTARTSVYIIFLLNCVAAVIWIFFDSMYLVTDDRLHWYYFSLIGSGLIPALLLHFISALVGLKNIMGWITASYILCAPLALSSPLALWNSGIKDFVDGNGWDVCFLVLLFSSCLAGMILLTRAIRKAKSEIETSRFRYVLVAMCIGCSFGTLLVLWDSPLISLLGHTATVLERDPYPTTICETGPVKWESLSLRCKPGRNQGLTLMNALSQVHSFCLRIAVWRLETDPYFSQGF